MARNPWAHSRTEDQRDAPVQAEQQYNAYAVPSLSAGDAFIDEFGWAPHVGPKTSTVDYPSAQRLQTIPRYDYYERAEEPSDRFRQDIDEDRKRRYSVEDQDADGWAEQKGINPGDVRWADNPRRHPPVETRLTEQLSPSTYRFTRFFDQLNRNYDGVIVGSARTFNGVHFSMADHRRKYDILTMTPARSRRNTYRLEPAPWDTDVVDLPPNNGTSSPMSRVRSVEIPSVDAATNRTYRLA